MENKKYRVKEKKFMKLITVREKRKEINKLIYKPEIMNKYLPYLDGFNK